MVVIPDQPGRKARRRSGIHPCNVTPDQCILHGWTPAFAGATMVKIMERDCTMWKVTAFREGGNEASSAGDGVRHDGDAHERN